MYRIKRDWRGTVVGGERVGREHEKLLNGPRQGKCMEKERDEIGRKRHEIRRRISGLLGALKGDETEGETERM